jgi:hypothetical protein
MYGEEGKAFQRLQEEIIKHTSDVSILAWILPPIDYSDDTGQNIHCGVLAKSPAGVTILHCAFALPKMGFQLRTIA